MQSLKKLSILSAGLIAAFGTIGNNSVQAASMKNEYTTVDKKIHVNFDEQVGVGSNPLYGGKKLDNLWSDYGLKLDSSLQHGGESELWLYNSNCKPEYGQSKNGFTNLCTGGDPDLATGKGKNGTLGYKSPTQGKVLIIQEDNGSHDLEPDDYADRTNPGTITFDFTDEVGVLFDSIALLDFDDPGQPIFSAVFADGSSTGDFSYNKKFFTEIDVKNNDKKRKTKNKKLDNKFEVKKNKANQTYISEMKFLSTSWNGNSYVNANNSLREYKFDFSDKRITQFNVTLPGSGAVTYVDYERKIKRKVPEPTSILSLLLGSVAVASVKRKRSS